MRRKETEEREKKTLQSFVCLFVCLFVFGVFLLFFLTTLNGEKTIRTVLSRNHDLSQPVFKNSGKYKLYFFSMFSKQIVWRVGNMNT